MRRPGPRLGAPKTRNFLLAFLDDVRNLRANAIMIIGVLSFACLVWFHSDRVFDERGAAARAVPAPRGSAAAGKPRDEAVDIEQAMTAILSNHEGVSQAASVAKQAVRREHQLRSAYKASAIFVIKQPGTNLHLAMRNAAKQGFIREIVVLHDMSQPTDAFGRAVGAWTDPPRDIYGKPVKYVQSTEDLGEMHKYHACTKHVRAASNVCFYQTVTRDTQGYLGALWATFLRAPDQLVTAVGATTWFIACVHLVSLPRLCS